LTDRVLSKFGDDAIKKISVAPEVLPESYEQLCKLQLPRPIHDDIDYDNTLEIVDRLATMPHRTPGQEEYLETLSILVERFDRDGFPESAPLDPIGRLKRLMAIMT